MSDSQQWITAEVELPEEVLMAHSEGRVVFFIGAGASCADPSSLPLFEQLVALLGKEAGVPYTKPTAGAAEALDRFLGRLTHLTPPYAVHERALAALTPPSSKPNHWHDAIVRLAAAYGHPRIVTTNFDDHLDAAALAAGVTFSDKWIGPALPLGHTVGGLVHLHGSVTRGHKELVLTDKDLGQAYMSEAWATRFLLRLFQENIVVFIGYGLTDPTMRYLALGLPSGASLYAFTRTSESADPDWARLGVKTIPFGEDFDNVPRALNAWGTRARMGRLDHRAQVETLVAAGTTLSPVDRDYLVARVSTPDGARDFAEATERLADDQKVAWLLWAESHPAFQELFAPREISEAAGVLGRWFSREFVASPSLHGAAFQTVLHLGQRLSSPLFRNACAQTWDLDIRHPIVAGRWRAFLATSIPGQSALLDSQWLLPTDTTNPLSPTDLRTALRPFLQLERRWFISHADDSTALPNAQIGWAAEEYALTPHLLRAVADAPDGDPKLGGVLEEALSSAYDLLRSYHGDRTWDPLSQDRSAIEPHAQDSIREPLDALVDALREYGIKALRVRRELPDRWWGLGYALFQRLALHLVTLDSSRSSDDKLQWLLVRSGLYPINLKHELFRLIAVSLPGSSANLRSQLLAAALEGPDLPDDLEDRDRHASYAKYNLLVWLTRSAPGWAEAAAAMSAAQEASPTFEPRDNPDFDTWMSDGPWGGRLPFSPEEFEALLSDSTVTALESLLSRDYSERRLEDPTWDDALTLVGQTTATRPDLGLCLWTEVETRGDLGGKAIGLKRAMINGWASADLREYGEKTTRRVASLADGPDSAHEIGRFLLEQIKRQVENDETPMLSSMRTLAQTLWVCNGGQFTHGDDDPLSSASLYLNSWPGFLAQYWLHEIDRRWRHDRDNWTGLNEEERTALIGLLRGPRAALDATQPAIARVLQFLFAADEDFTVEHVLPLFSEAASAIFAWHSYLYSPRWNDRILAAGLLESTRALWERLDELGGRGHRDQFFGFVAAILSWAGIDAHSRHGLLTQSVLSANGAHAADFAAKVSRFIAKDSVDGAQIWSHWLCTHLAERLDGVPRVAATEELTRWADVVPYLGDAIPEATNMLSQRGIGLDDDWFSPDIPEATLLSHGTSLITHYAERIANTTSSSMVLTRRVQRLVDLLRVALGDAQAQPLVDAARVRGFAAGWNDNALG